MLNEEQASFAFDTSQLGVFTDAQFRLELDTSEPIFRKPYRLAHRETEEARKQLAKLHESGLIEHSTSANYAAPIVMVAKKDEHGVPTDLRMCGD
jgi:hypothetical protein